MEEIKEARNFKVLESQKSKFEWLWQRKQHSGKNKNKNGHAK